MEKLSIDMSLVLHILRHYLYVISVKIIVNTYHATGKFSRRQPGEFFLTFLRK